MKTKEWSELAIAEEEGKSGGENAEERREERTKTFESYPVWVRIADPNRFGSVESSVNARPFRFSLGTVHWDLISCKRGLS